MCIYIYCNLYITSRLKTYGVYTIDNSIGIGIGSSPNLAPDHYYRDVVPFPHLPEPVLSAATQLPPKGHLLKQTLCHWTASGHYANANHWTKPCSTRRLNR